MNKIKTISIKVTDDENSLEDLIEYIKKVANIGHTFNVTVDPGNKDYEKSFEIDGDGTFYIDDIKSTISDTNVNDKEDNIEEIDIDNIVDDDEDLEEVDEIEIIEVEEALEDDDFELETSEQEISSANTSINSGKLPAIFKMVTFKPDTVNLDYGGGKFDNVADYLKDQNVTNLVYDPYNRSAEHNNNVIKELKKNGGADSATISNVLNVIKEPNARQTVLRNVYSLLKSGAPVYITVYEGTGLGDEKETKSGYQLNRKTQDYLEEVQKVFPNAKRKGKLIMATK